DSELEVVIAEQTGVVTILTAAGYELKRLELGNVITVFAVLTYGKRKLFVTGDHSPTLKIWDIDGNVLEQITVPAAPKAIASGTPDDVSDLAYLVIASRDRKLSFWEIRGPVKVTSEEKITLQAIESTKTTLYRRAIKCGNCGAPTSPEAPECSACGAKLQVLGEYVIEQYIQDSIDSITSRHTKMKLKDLDTILRKTLPQPAAYNLRRSIQAMLKKGKIEGHFDENAFVRTVKAEPKKLEKPSAEQVERAEEILVDLLRGKDTLDIKLLERKTGIDRRILRHTLLILLGEGAIQGTFYGDEFTLDRNERPEEFVRKMAKELQH
ncbi:MAG: zinc ribbon domain-containing protein, partial [Candidatus Thorarchaeota archaeon]|nr:zinc ribbon domain-containing protein [Candidatus Thorarchaeota archaeon]